MSGAEIRKLALESNVRLWKVAEAYGVTPQHFSILLRHSFSEENSKRLVEIIEELKA